MTSHLQMLKICPVVFDLLVAGWLRSPVLAAVKNPLAYMSCTSLLTASCMLLRASKGIENEVCWAGHIVYHGNREGCMPFFNDMGFQLPSRKGVPEFLQEVTSRKDQAVSLARGL